MNTDVPIIWRGANPFFRNTPALMRMMDRFFVEPIYRKSPGEVASFSPSCEFEEEKDRYIARFEIPGIPEDKIKFELSDNVLTVSGEKKEEKREESKTRHYSELSYGSFTRSMTLPTAVDASKVSTHYSNGVLTVSLAKSEVSKPRQICVK